LCVAIAALLFHAEYNVAPYSSDNSRITASFLLLLLLVAAALRFIGLGYRRRWPALAISAIAVGSYGATIFIFPRDFAGKAGEILSAILVLGGLFWFAAIGILGLAPDRFVGAENLRSLLSGLRLRRRG
jgi:hypothetical protein